MAPALGAWIAPFARAGRAALAPFAVSGIVGR